MLNPCCCITPRIGTFVFAIIDLLISLSALSYAVKMLSDNQDRFQVWVECGFAVLLLILAILLLIGAVKKDAEKLRLWLMIWIVTLICIFAFQIFNVISAPNAFERNRNGSSFVALIIFLYEIWVVYAFMYEIKYGPGGLTYCPAQVVV